MKKIVTVALVLLAAACFIPFETTLVPEWRIRVINEKGEPYPDQIVRRFCHDYTLRVDPCGETNESMRRTDKDGNVVFSEVGVSLSLASRAARSVVSLLSFVFLNGSFGVKIVADSSGPEGYMALEYVPGQQPPEVLVLPSNAN